MREIKFRAWVNSQQRMINVYGLFNKGFVYEDTFDYPCLNKNVFEAKYCHIMQFTGLFDKNGVEIFEGDVLIVRVEQASMPSFNFTAIVEYVPGEFILNDGNVFYYRINQYNSTLCYEVITNIYKDPIMKLSLKHPKTK